MKLLKLLLLWILIIKFVLANSNDSANYLHDTDWCLKNDQDYTEIIMIEDEENIIIPLASNQIYLRAKAVPTPVKNSHMIFYLSADIGKGGLSIPWHNISQEIAIAQIKLTEKNQLSFLWFGLFDIETNQPIDIPITSFNIGKEDINLMRCK